MDHHAWSQVHVITQTHHIGKLGYSDISAIHEGCWPLHRGKCIFLVQEAMLDEILLGGEILETLRADIWTETQMKSVFVALQIVTCRERLVTLLKVTPVRHNYGLKFLKQLSSYYKLSISSL